MTYKVKRLLVVRRVRPPSRAYFMPRQALILYLFGLVIYQRLNYNIRRRSSEIFFHDGAQGRRGAAHCRPSLTPRRGANLWGRAPASILVPPCISRIESEKSKTSQNR